MIIFMDQLTLLFSFLLTIHLSISGVISATFTIVNNCSYTVWPVIYSNGNSDISSTGFALRMGESTNISAPNSWIGRIWGRTQCTKDFAGNFSCVTGDCGSGKVECAGNVATLPVTLAEFSLGQLNRLDFYDVTMLDGYNLPMLVVPQGDSGGCRSTGCVADLDSMCPPQFKVMSANGKAVACTSTCRASGSSGGCSFYLQSFKNACPRAYTYSMDDNTSLFTCSAANYSIIFCPSHDMWLDSFASTSSIDNITSNNSIMDPETLSSYGSLFTLGFFSPENSTNRYVGIWYMSEPTIVWVANRNQPLMYSSGTVTISDDGNLVVLDGQKHIIWSSNVSNITSSTTCRLLDSGNLVLIDNLSKNIMWQSFEHPSDTLLPNMTITSSNKTTGEKETVTAWKSQFVPSIGNFYMSLERLDLPELFIWNATSPYWRSGPWNGQSFAQLPMISFRYNNGANQLSHRDGPFNFTFTLRNGSNIKEMVVLNSKGNLLHKQWNDTKKEWQEIYLVQSSDCDVYGICGPFGMCNSESSPICNCLSGFEPSNKEEWKRQNWIGGCLRKSALQCERVKNGTADGKEDTFYLLQMVKAPDFGEWSSESEDKCRSRCLENCTCKAYAYDSVLGCMSWKRDLIDLQQFSNEGINLHIRTAYSDIEKKRDWRFITIIMAITGAIIFSICAYILWKWITKRSEKTSDNIIGEQVKFHDELLVFDFEKVAIATNNFHLSNKLGQGGFGPVYKGTLQDGQDIAVKRLSRASGQGQEEFMNEMVVISKLQHCNLVKLFGCCIKGEEKMLIYEYMPNKSLDAFIFDPQNCKLLDWTKRFVIIEGIARGVLYLHRDSRLKIIHRDLKASNILLDEKMIPKISDFGMAKIFKGNEDHANTRRVVGTYGYMSPEYAMDGLFSEKSDVFSFGVLLLEIISGRRNSSFYNDEHSLSLLGFAWKLWNEENIALLIDPEISNPGLEKDIMRCIHIGLLCVQELAIERPSMSIVISMLNSEIVNLPPPRQPAFTQWQSVLNYVPPEENQRLFSNNYVSISDIQGR